MSIEAFKRIFWIVLDGMSIEHARLCAGSVRFPGITKMAREGYLDACKPSSPACQTPTALLTLFSGTEPRESGAWGYFMPDPRRPTDSISGFSAPTKQIRTIWEDLGDRGLSFSLMNVAFRHDRVWSGRAPGLDFGYDGYRLWKKSRVFPVDRAGTRIDFQGIELALDRTREGLLIRKGSRTKAELLPGQWRLVDLTSGSRTYACLLDEVARGIRSSRETPRARRLPPARCLR